MDAGGIVAAVKELEDAAGVGGGDEVDGGREFEGGELAGVEVSGHEVTRGAPFAEFEGCGVVDVGFEGVPVAVVDGPGAGIEGVQEEDEVIGVFGGDAIGVADLAGVPEGGAVHVDTGGFKPERTAVGGFLFVGGVLHHSEGAAGAEIEECGGVGGSDGGEDEIVDGAEADVGAGGEEGSEGGDAGGFDGVGIGGRRDGKGLFPGEELLVVGVPPVLPAVGVLLAECLGAGDGAGLTVSCAAEAGFGDGGVGDLFEGGGDFAVGAGDADCGECFGGCAGETVVGDELPEGGVVDSVAEIGNEDGGFGEGADEGGDCAGVVDGAESEGEGAEFAVGSGAVEFGAEFGDGGFADGDEVADDGVGFFGGGGGDDGVAELIEESAGMELFWCERGKAPRRRRRRALNGEGAGDR